MGVVVGLDIGTRTITGVVVSGNPKKFRVTDFFVEDIPDLAGGLSEGDRPVSEEVDLDDDSPVTAGELIGKLLRDRGLQNADVVASIESKNCIVREIWVPFTRSDQIEKTLAFEAENSLITFDIEDMVLEYHKVKERDGKSQLLLFAARHATIASRLQILSDGGVDPLRLDLDSAALFNAFASTPLYDPERNTLLIDVGAQATSVLLVENGTLRKARTIRLGALLGHSSTRRLPAPADEEEPAGERVGGDGRLADFLLPDASSIEARFDEIENALRRLDPLAPGEGLETPGEGGGTSFDLEDDDEPIAILTDDEFDRVASGDYEETVEETAEPEPGLLPSEPGPAVALEEPPAPAYSEFLERLGYEIQRTFATNFIRSPVELICFCGGKAQVEETRRYFTEEFDVETIPLDFGDTFETDLSSHDRDRLNRLGGVAVGLALKEMGGDRLDLDFRQGPYRYERRFDKLKYPLLLTGILLCALFLQLVYDNLKQWQYWDLRQKSFQAKSQQFFDTFWGDLAEKNRPGNGRYVRATDAITKELEEVMGGASSVPFVHDINALVSVDAVFKKARQQGIRFEIDMIDLNLQTRRRKMARGNQRNTQRQPTVEASNSRIKFTTDDSTAGDAIAKMFKQNTQIFEAFPSVSKSGDRYIVMLELRIQENYLRYISR